MFLARLWTSNYNPLFALVFNVMQNRVFAATSFLRSLLHAKKTEYYPEMVVHTVEEMARNFVTDLLSSVRERGIDTKSTYTIFIGGGAILLRRFLESSSRLIKYQFIDDIFANAKGYGILYRSSLAGK